jgi:hypothetical protein
VLRLAPVFLRTLGITRVIVVIFIIKIFIILIIPILQRRLGHIKLRQRMRNLKRISNLSSIPPLMRLMASIVPFREIENAPIINE